MFVCLGFYVALEYFLLIWICHIYGWRASKLHLNSALSEGSLTSHICCDRRHPFIMVISAVDQWQLSSSVWRWICHYPVFYDLGLSRLGFEYLNFCMRFESSKRLQQRSGSEVLVKNVRNKSKRKLFLSWVKKKY